MFEYIFFSLKSWHKASASENFSSDKSSSIEATFKDKTKYSDEKTSGKMLNTTIAANGHGELDLSNQKKDHTSKDKNTAGEDKQTTHKVSKTNYYTSNSTAVSIEETNPAGKRTSKCLPI